MGTSANFGAAIAAAVIVGVGFGGVAHAAPVEMVIQSDTVQSGPCTLANQFKHGGRVVFRARVVDTATGNGLDDKALQSVTVQLGDGTTLKAAYDGHPPGKNLGYYWTAAWVVPASFPTGTLGYKIVATNTAGTTATFTPFEVPSSQLTVVADK